MALIDDLDPIFADCVYKEGETRYAIHEPWVHDGFVYATDGRIVVRQPTELPSVPHKGPSAWELFRDSKPCGERIPLPDLGPEPPECGRCKGKAPRRCSRCDGSGECTCDVCGSNHDCAVCNGNGVRLCSACDRGKPERKSVRLSPGHEYGLADHFARLLQRHGVSEVQKASKGSAFCFRRGSIEGIVMGMTLGEADV